MPRPEVSIVDRAAVFPTKVGVGLSVCQVKVVTAEEVELMNGETEFPRDVGPMEGGRFDFLRGFSGFSGFSSVGVRHGMVFKVLSEWVRL